MNIIQSLSKTYDQGLSIIDDQTYDELYDLVEAGAIDDISDLTGNMDTMTGGKVTLPKQMKSMSKFKSKEEFDRWTSKLDPHSIFNISSKMDGISLLITENKAYTRGNGVKGQDVTWIKEMLNIPSPPTGTMVRGEFIMTIEGWDKIISVQPDIATTPLAYIAGFANSKTHDETHIEHMHFVAFQYIDDPNIEKPLIEQFTILQDLGYETVQHSIFVQLEYDSLQDILDSYRESSPYVLDGIIIAEECAHQRIDDKNPSFARAYKDHMYGVSEVTHVEWNESRYGTMKPIVHIEKISLGGKEYSKTSGHNAAFIQNNLISTGAIVNIGINIVPNIASVISPGDQEDTDDIIQDMIDSGYFWKGKELVSTDKESVNRRIKMIVHFFKHLEIEGLKEGRVSKLIAKGHETLFDILRMSSDDFNKVLGKVGKDIHLSIQTKWNMANDELLFVASGFFQGFGKVLTETLFDNMTMIELISGQFPKAIDSLGPKRVAILQEGFPEFLDWLIKIPPRNNIQKRKVKTITKDTVFVQLTGEPPREKYINKEAFLKAYPNLMTTGKWKSTDLVISDALDSGTSKNVKAIEQGIPRTTYVDYDLDNP